MKKRAAADAISEQSSGWKTLNLKNKNVFFIYFLDINCLDVFKIYIF